MDTVNILNCNIAKVKMTEVIGMVEDFIKVGEFHSGGGINADQLVKINESPVFKEIMQKSDILFADGMSVIFASNLLRTPLPERVGATDVFENLLNLAVEKNYGVFFLGTKDKILEKAIDHYRTTYKGLKISGYRNGYWKPDEEDDVVEKINSCSPDLLFLGMSSPKKEEFIERNKHQLKSVSFALGVGGAFDIHAGEYARAPVWMQKLFLEWFFRLLQEPRRLFWRYSVNNTKFLYLLSKGILKRMATSN
ncbi:WecB/TagA/CpsF family glycosyltransferase [Maribacter sp. 2308TA10-17]|uniref:WecB/TagA/CpsF family glycosyltransferase n=1 Tax=Maribacter sp. 2308TA10-17 TaxID=3386276 RepID=UPI0039BC350A